MTLPTDKTHTDTVEQLRDWADAIEWDAEPDQKHKYRQIQLLREVAQLLENYDNPDYITY